MIPITKELVKYAALLLFGVLLWFGIVYSGLKSAELPLPQEINAPQNIATSYSPIAGTAIRKSRESAVRIVSMGPDGAMATTSGTYVTYKGHRYVLTVNHGIMGSCETELVLAGQYMTNCIEISTIDMVADYALIEVGIIGNRRPILIPNDIPWGRRWLTNLSALTTVFYTGYPNSLGPLTIDGHVAGYSGEDYIYLHSYAWAGSSGSGVFSERGNLIGYVMAVNVGYTEYGYDVLEDIVVVVPVFNVDWGAAHAATQRRIQNAKQNSKK